MNKVSGQLRIKGLHAAATELTIHVYIVGARQVPANILDPHNWDTLYGAEWKGLDAVRIGSTNSDLSGRFVFNYDAKDLPRSLREEGRLNLWLAVTGSDLIGKDPCHKVIYASCDIRIGAGVNESFLLYLDAQRLRQLGLLNGTPMIKQQGVTAFEVLSAVEAVAAKTALPNLNGVSFSKHFNDARTKRVAAAAKAKTSPPRQSQFSLSIGLRQAGNTPEQPGFAILSGDTRESLQVQAASEPNSKPLVFQGIERRVLTPQNNDRAPVQVKIDVKNGGYVLALAHVPDDLKLAQNDPLALWVPTEPK